MQGNDEAILLGNGVDTNIIETRNRKGGRTEPEQVASSKHTDCAVASTTP